MYFIFAFSISVHAGMSVWEGELRVSGPWSPESALPVELCRHSLHYFPALVAIDEV